MKKIAKTLTMLLALGMTSAVMAGCDDSNTKRVIKESNQTQEAKEKEVKETKASDAEEETSAEITEETNETELIDYSEHRGGFIISEGYDNDDYSFAFHAFMNKIDELNAENPNLKYAFTSWDSGEGNFGIYLLAGEPVEGESAIYCDKYVLSDDELIKAGEDILWYPNFSYEEIKKLPFLLSDIEYCGDKIYDELPDGDYVGMFYGVTKDGSKAVFTIAPPVILSEDEYKNLKAGDLVFDRSNEFFSDLYVSDSYNGTNEMFDEEHCRFIKNENGDYVLMDDATRIAWQGETSLAVIDIDKNCRITDKSGYPFGSDLAEDCIGFMSTPAYKYFTERDFYVLKSDNWYIDEYTLRMQDWYWGGLMGWPITVSGNTITGMVLDMNIS